MKKVLILGLLVLLMGCSGCNGKLTEETDRDIKQAFYDGFVWGTQWEETVDVEDLPVQCVGVFGDCYGVFLEGLRVDRVAARDGDVDGLDFVFPQAPTLFVYKDGGLYSVSEAFEKGFLNRNELQQLQSQFVGAKPLLNETEIPEEIRTRMESAWKDEDFVWYTYGGGGVRYFGTFGDCIVVGVYRPILTYVYYVYHEGTFRTGLSESKQDGLLTREDVDQIIDYQNKFIDNQS